MQSMNFDFKRPLDRQLAELKDAIRAKPQDAPLRVFYFQVLAVYGGVAEGAGPAADLCPAGPQGGSHGTCLPGGDPVRGRAP